MTNLPTSWTGGNPFGPEFQRIVDTLLSEVSHLRGRMELLEASVQIKEEKFPGGVGGVFPIFIARITGVFVSVPGNRWFYNWEEVRLSPTGSGFETFTGARDETSEGAAGINYAEILNTDTTINYGQDISPSTTNADITVKEIQTGSIVPMQIVTYGPDNLKRAIFSASPNPIEVVCRDVRKPQPVPPGETPQPPP